MRIFFIILFFISIQTHAQCIVQVNCKQTVQYPAMARLLSAVNTTDKVELTTWTQISGPSRSLIMTPAGLTTAVSSLWIGTYIYGFTVLTNMQSVTVRDTLVVIPAPVDKVDSTFTFYHSGKKIVKRF